MSPILTTKAPGKGSAGIHDPSFASTATVRICFSMVSDDYTRPVKLLESHRPTEM